MTKPRLSRLLFAAAMGGAASSVHVPVQSIAAPVRATHLIAAHPAQVPPWSLTASDGSGLMVMRVDAKAVLEGPLAFTELHLYFHNAEARQREGTFSITLPPRAAVSRFAMETNGQMMEAEVVEKTVARRAYDDFLHRRQDPALLEKSEGNQFTAKVFPIPGNSDKHIVISFSQELPGARYVLPLRGLPKIARVDVELATLGADGKRSKQTLIERNWTPDRDFVSDVTTGVNAIVSGTILAAQVDVFEDRQVAEDVPSAMTILVDTSASRSLGYAAYVKSVRALIGKMPAAMPLDVIAFDQDRETIFTGNAGGWGDAHDRKLIERGAAGASDLAQALAGIAAHAKSRVVVVTDGVITAGAQHAGLIAAGKQIRAERIDVVLAGGIRDDVAPTELVRALPHAGAVLDLEDGAEAVAKALAAPVKTDVKIEIPGATWVYPRTLASVRAGTSAMVYARMAKPVQALDLPPPSWGGSAARVGTVGAIDVIVGGVKRHLAIREGTAPLVERAVGSAEIQELEAKLANASGAAATELKRDIARKSVKSRVVSSQTSLLVLESDGDYARYGIDRTSLADVLVVGPNGTIVRSHRNGAPLVQQIAASNRPGTSRVREEDRPGTQNKDLESLGSVGAGADGANAGKLGLRPTDEAAVSVAIEEGKRGMDESIDRADEAARAESKPTEAAPRSAGRAPSAPEPSLARSRAQRGASPTAQRGGYGAAAVRDMPLEQEAGEQWPPRGAPVALTGKLAAIEHAIARRDIDGALAKARDWNAQEPGNVLALIGLGDALEAKGNLVTASRVYGSIIDLFPARADMRRFAGERLARIARTNDAVGQLARNLMVDTFRRAVEDRPDHMTGRRLLAYALVRANRPAEAFDAILAAIDQPYRNDSYAGGQRTLADDAGMIAATYLAASPASKFAILNQLTVRKIQLATQPSTRFILYWETDGNDVDFHIQDSRGGHAFYGNRTLRSGGELYADITTGYGPECFAIPGTPKAGPYRLSINYYSQGPMGYGMGLLEVQRFDGRGGMTFDDRPYVIMADHAFVDLGSWQ